LAYFPGDQGEDIKTLYNSFSFEEAKKIEIKDENL
jgi:hypothetical protein